MWPLKAGGVCESCLGGSRRSSILNGSIENQSNGFCSPIEKTQMASTVYKTVFYAIHEVSIISRTYKTVISCLFCILFLLFPCFFLHFSCVFLVLYFFFPFFFFLLCCCKTLYCLHALCSVIAALVTLLKVIWCHILFVVCPGQLLIYILV